MSFYSDVEQIIKNQGEAGIIQLEYYNGVDLELSRQSKDSAYSGVHGRDAGQPTTVIKEIIGMLQGDDFFEANTTQRPGFIAGFLYTRDRDVVVGDVIQVIMNNGGRGRQYKVGIYESIGLTVEILKRYKLSAMGDVK